MLFGLVDRGQHFELRPQPIEPERAHHAREDLRSAKPRPQLVEVLEERDHLEPAVARYLAHSPFQIAEHWDALDAVFALGRRAAVRDAIFHLAVGERERWVLACQRRRVRRSSDEGPGVMQKLLRAVIC
eukprot:683097-Rhodomonas_salina.2